MNREIPEVLGAQLQSDVDNLEMIVNQYNEKEIERLELTEGLNMLAGGWKDHHAFIKGINMENYGMGRVACGDLIKAIKEPVISGLWDRLEPSWSGEKLFRRLNLPNLDVDNQIINFSNMAITYGDLSVPTNVKVRYNRSRWRNIELRWSMMINGIEELKDRLNVIAILGDWIETHFGLKVYRCAGKYSIHCDVEPGEENHFYLFFTNSKGEFSPCGYVNG